MIYILGIALGIVGIVMFHPAITLIGIALSMGWIINNYAEQED